MQNTNKNDIQDTIIFKVRVSTYWRGIDYVQVIQT